MDKTTLPGLLLGLASLVAMFLMEGGEIQSLFAPSAATLVFGGTFAATLISFPLERVLNLPRLFVKAITDRPLDERKLVELLVGLAERARREGLLALESELSRIEDRFVRSGVMLVVDGSDPETVREILETDLEAMERRHEAGYGMLEAMGGYAPTMGIIGTVMGLVHVLGNLSDPESLGPAIAAAFIATLYGVASANLVWLPLAGKLKVKSRAELAVRELALQGILSVQAGDNPRLVREKLTAHLAPQHRKRAERAATAGAAQVAASQG